MQRQNRIANLRLFGSLTLSHMAMFYKTNRDIFVLRAMWKFDFIDDQSNTLQNEQTRRNYKNKQIHTIQRYDNNIDKSS